MELTYSLWFMMISSFIIQIAVIICIVVIIDMCYTTTYIVNIIKYKII